ncbi:MAG: DsbA family protein [Pseudomonadota bacterium]
MTDELIAYTDIKSPYAYLALEPTLRMTRKAGVSVDWQPYTLDIPDYLGDAEVDAGGNIVRSERSPHQWRRVKYSYMDVRRYANLRGLTIRGHPKIRNTKLASTAILWARDQGRAASFLAETFPPFWRREIDIEDVGTVTHLLRSAGCEVNGFPEWARGEGAARHDDHRQAAEASGIFGVPWFVWQGEVFWGREALPLVAHRITGALPDWAADLGLAPDDGL